MHNKFIFFILFSFASMNFFAAEFELSTNNDGKIDRWITGELIKDWEKFDINKNDKPDESIFYVNSTNKVFLISEEKFDISHKGKPNVWIKYTVSGNDFYSETTTDEDLDGKIDSIAKKKNDVLVSTIIDTNKYGVFDLLIEYNSKGNEIKESIDTNHDGIYDDFYYFDDNDKFLKEELDTNYDGKPDMWVYFHYKEDGSLKESIIEKDNNFDGIVDERQYTNDKREVIRIEKSTKCDGNFDDIKTFTPEDIKNDDTKSIEEDIEDFKKNEKD